MLAIRASTPSLSAPVRRSHLLRAGEERVPLIAVKRIAAAHLNLGPKHWSAELVPARHLATNDDGDRLPLRAGRKFLCGESLLVREKDSDPSLAAVGVHAFGQLRHVLESCEGRFAETFTDNAIEAVDATGCVENTPVRQRAGGCRRGVTACEQARRSEDRSTPSNETSHGA